mmetsp:Transcript_49373/g.124141  ORF Transcript_49373/g.124141 Transcript_49373/m.124141 type:complete len:275 (+) Transcript_49373:1287-2111(+)
MAEKDCGSGRWIGRVALVTGASSGIGAEIARRLVMQAGMHVIGVARSLEGMEQAVSATLSKEEQNRFTALRLDLADLAALEAFFSTDLPVHLSSRGLPECVHVLVNNAGVGYDAPLLSGSTAEWQTMLTVNVLALSVCTREVLRMQKDQGVEDGHIFHISSMASHRVPGDGSSGIAMYSATKFAVRALTEGLRKELRAAKSKTRVTSISPGLVQTGFASHYMRGDEEKADRFFQKGVHDILQSSDVADATLYALLTPPHCQVHDILMRPTEQKG